MADTEQPISRGELERDLTELPKPGHSREDYEACLKYASEHRYFAMHSAISEGYDPNVDWRSLMKD